MIKRIIVLGFILLLSLGFVDKEISECRAINHLMYVSKNPVIDIEINEVWSSWKGPCNYKVFIDYKANNIELVSMFEVKKLQVVSGIRVSE